jgi:hypothetical protein
MFKSTLLVSRLHWKEKRAVFWFTMDRKWGSGAILREYLVLASGISPGSHIHYHLHGVKVEFKSNIC